MSLQVLSYSALKPDLIETVLIVNHPCIPSSRFDDEAIKYAVEPLEPTDVDFLRIAPLSGVPVGNLEFPFPDIDRERSDSEMVAGVICWMSGWSYAGESGLHSRNDGLFRIIDHLACLTYKLRDLHDNSTVVTTRTDVTMGYSGCALLLAEEKDSARIEEAIADLQRKFQWISYFHNLPFVFGIAITRTAFQILALERSGRVRAMFRTQLSNDTERWSCVIASINIARVLRYFITNEMFVPVMLDMNKWIDRERGKKVRIGMRFIEVEYADESAFQKLKTFYARTAERGVLHIERLYTAGPEQAVLDDTRRFRLVPVGLCRMPDNEEELTTAIQHVLKCVVELHSLGYCHCDIRWSNIVWTERGWYLIDCTFATSLDDIAQLRHMSATIKEQYVFDRSTPWSPRHDFFQIGLLISGSAYRNSSAFNSLRDYLCDHSNTEIDVGYFMDTWA